MQPSIIEVMFPWQKGTAGLFFCHTIKFVVAGCFDLVFFSRRFCFGEFESIAVKVEKEMSQHYAKIIKVSLRIPSSRVAGRTAEAEVATDSPGEDEVPVTET